MRCTGTETGTVLLFLAAVGGALLPGACESDPEPGAASAPPATPPNILWLVAEDLSPIIPPYGDTTVETPHLSRLADEGIRYTNAFSVSGVCAPPARHRVGRCT